MEVNVGERAPHFSLRAHDKSEVSLNDYHGKNVVLLFFPLAFSSVCTKELCAMRDELSDYNHLNTEVIAISVDSLYTLRKFKEDYGYNFQLLSDFNKEVSRSFGVLHEEFGLGMRGVAKRSVFIIDKEGIIRHKQIKENPAEMPDFRQVLETLAIMN
ncbi:MAG: peroxiredoxin [Saprospiraceae bacterium]|nr:peroxiredoxin [Saprospiraceae bacterium]